MKRKILIGFLFVVGFVVAGYFAISAKVYPVATVNGTVISARTFELARQAAAHYYQNLSLSESAQVDGAIIRQTVLSALIEDALVTKELEQRYEPASLAQAVEERVRGALETASSTIDKAVSDLFGVTVEEFSALVLAPRARVEILAADLSKEQISFDVWLDAALQSAEVSIVLNDLAWENGRVALTGEQPYTAKVQELFEQIASTSQALEAASSTATQP